MLSNMNLYKTFTNFNTQKKAIFPCDRLQSTIRVFTARQIVPKNVVISHQVCNQ